MFPRCGGTGPFIVGSADSPPMRRAVLALVVVTATIVPGCTSCDPETVQASVELTLSDEEVRTLPILASGGTRVAGQEIADSHGRLEVDVNVTHRNISRVEVDDLTLEVSVNGTVVPVEVTNVGGGSGWEQADDESWSGQAPDGSTLTVHWVVDRDDADPEDLVLPEGTPYQATVDFTWSYEGCSIRAHGTVHQSFDDHVQASVDAQTFRTVDRHAEWDATGAGFNATYETTSGLVVTVEDVTALAVFHASDATPGIGLVTFEEVGWNVSGDPGNTVTPEDRLNVHSSDPTDPGGGYAASGTVAPPTLMGQPGLMVLSVTIQYRPDDPTASAETDSFVYGLVQE